MKTREENTAQNIQIESLQNTAKHIRVLCIDAPHSNEGNHDMPWDLSLSAVGKITFDSEPIKGKAATRQRLLQDDIGALAVRFSACSELEYEILSDLSELAPALPIVVFGLDENTLNRENFLRRGATEYVEPDRHSADVTEIFCQALARHEATYRLRQELSQRDAALAHILGQGDDLFGDFSQLVKNIESGLLGELHRLRRALEASRLKNDAFVYKAAHDLRQPVREVRIVVNELLENTPKSEPLTRVSEHMEYQDRLIRELLEFARIGKESMHEEVDLNIILRQVQFLLQNYLRQEKVKIDCKELPKIEGNRSTLTSLFQNLIENAIKYCRQDRRPHLVIDAVQAKREWLIRICDNGVGIPPAERYRVFRPLVRLDGNRSGGTGLGLANCQKVVERHGGRIWIEGNDLGGTTVCLTLPLSTW